MAGGTRDFSVDGSSVSGTGDTPSSGSDHFYGSAGAGYTVSVAPGASLFSRFAIRRGQSPGPGTIGAPDGELIVIDHGTLTNDGTLNVYPASSDPPGSGGCDYCQTGGVVDITGSSGQPSSVVNRGTIGDRVPGSSFGGATAEHGYGQIDSFGVMMADGTVVNEAGGLITGNNGIFTTGNAAANRIDNYGDIDATNDGALSSYLIVNHQGGAINTGPAGFACVHAYGDVVNDGYMLGSDYGMLLEGAGTRISDYGGPPVPGVRNFDGSAVYNGEISAISRSTNAINTGGPYLSADAVMMDTSHSTFTLNTTTSGGTVWLPVINGPMVGGFNGDFNSASAHQVNTLAFDFAGLPAAQLAQLRTAVAQSAVSGAGGTYYSGQTTIAGHAYHWVDWASVTVSGKAVAPSLRHQRQRPGRRSAHARHAAGKHAPSAVAQAGMPSPVAIAIARMPATATPAAGSAGLPWADLGAVALPAVLITALALVALRRRRARQTRALATIVTGGGTRRHRPRFPRGAPRGLAKHQPHEHAQSGRLLTSKAIAERWGRVRLACQSFDVSKT